MEAVVLNLELQPQQYEQLTAIAQARQVPITEMARAVVTEWLERQKQLEQARALLRQLGQGLGEGQPPHHTARDHDTYLYSHPLA